VIEFAADGAAAAADRKHHPPVPQTATCPPGAAQRPSWAPFVPRNPLTR